MPTDALDVVVLLLPSLGFLAMTVRWKRETRRHAASQTECRRLGDLVGQVCDERDRAEAQARQLRDLAQDWHHEAVGQAAVALALNDTSRSN